MGGGFLVCALFILLINYCCGARAKHAEHTTWQDMHQKLGTPNPAGLAAPTPPQGPPPQSPPPQSSMVGIAMASATTAEP